MKYMILSVNKEALATKIQAAFEAGKAPDKLALIVEDKLYASTLVECSLEGIEALQSLALYQGVALALGDLIIAPTGHVFMLAGPGDFNDVTTKVEQHLATEIHAVRVVPPQAQAAAEEEEDEPDDEEEDDEPDDGKVEAAAVPATGYFKQAEIGNARNVEREEMQGLIRDAALKMFQEQGIPLNSSHSRRAVRAFMRLGVRMALDHGQSPHALMSVFCEAVQKEAATTGKKIKVRTVTGLRFDKDGEAGNADE